MLLKIFIPNFNSLEWRHFFQIGQQIETKNNKFTLLHRINKTEEITDYDLVDKIEMAYECDDFDEFCDVFDLFDLPIKSDDTIYYCEDELTLIWTWLNYNFLFKFS